MEAVCLTGSDVFKSGLPLKISNTEGGWGQGGQENTKEKKTEHYSTKEDMHFIHKAFRG